MIEEKDELKAISEGDRVKAFLEDEIVKAAWDRVEKRYFAEFRTSTEQSDILMVHARARALVDVAKELRAVMSNGERASEQRQQRQKREEQLQRNRRPSR